MTVKISGAVVVSEGIEKKSDIYLKDTQIIAVTTEELPYDKEIDASGMYAASGFIDMHTHGAGGFDFLDNTEEAFIKISQEHAKHGATSIVPTITSSTKESMLEAAEVFDRVKGRNINGANLLGLHLEGPYFAMSQKGAQDEKFIRAFDRNEYREILEKTDSVIRWTGAPELEGSEDFAETLVQKGVLACIGHSDADSDITEKAFKNGFTHVTHLYSCTSMVHRKNAFRYAGIVEAAYLNDDMSVEIIADGIHLPADLLKLVYKIKGPKKTALITDSMRGAGMADGPSILGGKKDGLEVIIEDGVAKLPDRTAFAGSVASCDRLVKNMVRLAQVPLADAVMMASQTPAEILKIKGKGKIKPGYDADIVIFDKDINVYVTIVGGKVVYSR